MSRGRGHLLRDAVQHPQAMRAIAGHPAGARNSTWSNTVLNNADQPITAIDSTPSTTSESPAERR